METCPNRTDCRASMARPVTAEATPREQGGQHLQIAHDRYRPLAISCAAFMDVCTSIRNMAGQYVTPDFLRANRAEDLHDGGWI